MPGQGQGPDQGQGPGQFLMLDCTSDRKKRGGAPQGPGGLDSRLLNLPKSRIVYARELNMRIIASKKGG